MSERREFVEVERLGNMARYSVEIPITTDTIYARMDELEQRINDVTDAALCDFKHAEHCVDALERRIEKLERLLNHKGERTMDERTGGSE